MAISATDLRIGNLVSHEGMTYEVWSLNRTKIELDSAEYDTHINNLKYEDIEPVPLTEEWLNKFGFKKCLIENDEINGHYYELDLHEDLYNDLSLISAIKNNTIEVCLFPYGESFVFKYVHTLQNIFFALSGEELQPTL